MGTVGSDVDFYDELSLSALSFLYRFFSSFFLSIFWFGFLVLIESYFDNLINKHVPISEQVPKGTLLLFAEVSKLNGGPI
jgi:hypothetical protein